jgi:hypothetical protein
MCSQRGDEQQRPGEVIGLDAARGECEQERGKNDFHERTAPLVQCTGEGAPAQQLDHLRSLVEHSRKGACNALEDLVVKTRVQFRPERER